MSDYKRYVEKRNGENVIPLRNAICGIDMPKWELRTANDNEMFLSGEAVDRLAELEDKIENGTLIETKYHIYQDVYFIDYVDENNYSVGSVKGKPTIRKCFIRSVEQVMKGQILYLIQPHDLPQEVVDNKIEHTEMWEWCHYSDKDLFLTKPKAESKLEQIRKENNNG